MLWQIGKFDVCGRQERTYTFSQQFTFRNTCNSIIVHEHNSRSWRNSRQKVTICPPPSSASAPTHFRWKVQEIRLQIHWYMKIIRLSSIILCILNKLNVFCDLWFLLTIVHVPHSDLYVRNQHESRYRNLYCSHGTEGSDQGRRISWILFQVKLCSSSSVEENLFSVFCKIKKKKQNRTERGGKKNAAKLYIG